MDSSDFQHPRFHFYDSLSNLVSNDDKNEEVNWGMDSSSFPFNSNIVSSLTNESYFGFDMEEENKDVYDLNFQSQPNPNTTSSISGNNMEDSMESQLLEWKVKSQSKQIDFSMEIKKIELESLKSLQPHFNFDPIQAYEEQGRYEDGYKWRKYGEKQIKGSKRSRSYFKCSYTDCVTRKKVEKDLNGYIIEIIYKGKHSHPKPQNIKKSSSDSFQDTTLYHAVENIDSKPVSIHSSVFFGEDKYEQGFSNSNSGNDDDYETKAKKRKLDDDISYVGGKMVQAPRVVIQTKSEIDIIDDGYKWRKYGQKPVKGNPNPRSYYKCTNNGCPVRKLVERASNDWQAVITTYEAKHNHGVPIPRGGGDFYAIHQGPMSSTTNTDNKHVPITTRP